LEKKITIPIWIKIFKSLGIYDQQYHEQYRKYIHEKRYKTYIDLVVTDLKNKILGANKKQIENLIETKFSKKLAIQ